MQTIPVHIEDMMEWSIHWLLLTGIQLQLQRRQMEIITIEMIMELATATMEMEPGQMKMEICIQNNVAEITLRLRKNISCIL